MDKAISNIHSKHSLVAKSETKFKVADCMLAVFVEMDMKQRNKADEIAELYQSYY